MGDPRPIAVLPLRPSWYLIELVHNETPNLPEKQRPDHAPGHISGLRYAGCKQAVWIDLRTRAAPALCMPAAERRSRTRSRAGRDPLHRRLFLGIVDIAEGAGHRQHLPAVAIAHQAVPLVDTAFDVECIPLFRVSDVIDRNVIVLAPEEWNVGKPLPLSEHVARRGLALPFGHNPVLDPQTLAVAGVGPARDIPGGKKAGRASLEIFVHRHAAVDLQAGALGQLETWPYANADDHEVCRQGGAALELDAGTLDRGRRFLEMERDAVFLVNGANEFAEFAPQHALQRMAIRRHHVNFDLPRSQRGSDLEPDETCPEHHRAPRRFRFGDDRTRIGQRTQYVHVRLIGAGDIEADGLGAGREQQLIERHA